MIFCLLIFAFVINTKKKLHTDIQRHFLKFVGSLVVHNLKKPMAVLRDRFF